MCALFSQKKFPHFLTKKVFFFGKHNLSKKLEGGTGLQGVISNLNVVLCKLRNLAILDRNHKLNKNKTTSV